MAQKTNPLVQVVGVLLQALGLDARLFDQEYDPDMFGNAIALYRCGPLTLRFTRDRSQEWLEIGMQTPFVRGFLFEDIEVAMGWKAFDESASSTEPEPLFDVLRRLADHRTEIADLLSHHPERVVQAEQLRTARAEKLYRR
jgi:hypothetical protein